MNPLSGKPTQLSAPLSVALAPRQTISLEAPLATDLVLFRSARLVSPSPRQAPSAPTPAGSSQIVDEILFIDRRVSGYQSLEAGVRSGMTIIELHPNQDGIVQISDALEQFRVRKAVHIVSLGDKGVVRLGAAQFSNSTLGLYSSDLKSWATSFDTGVEILIYGSNFGVDRKLLERVSTLTGANIAASSDRTGSSTLGGDWELEQKVVRVNTAAIATQLAFQPTTLNTYAATFSL
ncbi:DUF4347 domain-containing protein [Myxacorys almedinensis]|uniref:DUF4347 domain-containing protein n=1 Tax=Myxacorys almedinensis A TaxID=2690445 RepID=A0A8J7Z468_9CYAN|nr:DUF4347 domain-containing protein [Myxacorys almedinensis]NDJ19679.1 DUF4347 domain-containing protein [Myxacorys almedinensis A]